MTRLEEKVIRFFERQHYVIVSTVGPDGIPHSACKGLVKMTRAGEVRLLDLYRGSTSRNLAGNPCISVTSVDEHTFAGYCLKGEARLEELSAASARLIRAWERKLSSRITHRIIRSLQGERGHPRQPEALLPKPTHLIVMRVREVADLTPAHIGG